MSEEKTEVAPSLPLDQFLTQRIEIVKSRLQKAESNFLRAQAEVQMLRGSLIELDHLLRNTVPIPTKDEVVKAEEPDKD